MRSFLAQHFGPRSHMRSIFSKKLFFAKSVHSKISNKIQTPLENLFSTIGDPKSSKRRYQNHSKMERFSGLAQNLRIMLPPARGLTFRGSSHSKIIPFSDFVSMPAVGRPETLFFQFFDKKRGPRGYPKSVSKPFENRVNNEPLTINLLTPFQAPKMASEIT